MVNNSTTTAVANAPNRMLLKTIAISHSLFQSPKDPCLTAYSWAASRIVFGVALSYSIDEKVVKIALYVLRTGRPASPHCYPSPSPQVDT
jgi:hypothetical protein